jgi:hypothetical protein
MLAVSHLKKVELRLKTCEDFTFCRERWSAFFGTLQGVLVIVSLIEQRTIDTAYYSKLLKVRVTPVFPSKRRGRSVKSVCLLHDKARPHTAAVTTGTLEKCIGEYCSHSNYSLDPAPSDFHLFGALKEAPGGKRLEATMKFNFLCREGWTSNHKLFLKGE